MKKLILSLFCGVLGFSYAQETDANILGSVEIGGSRYYVLQEHGTGKYFKSEITSLDVLKYGDIVKLEQQLDPNGFQQIKDASFNNLFKAKEQAANLPNNGANYVDPQILFRLPKVKNGILYFENKKHFDELYSFIEIYLDNKKDIPGKKDALSLIEAQILDYTSFRKYFNEKYPDEGFDGNGFSELQIEQIEKEDFLHDEILKVFLNKYRMLVIGTDVYSYHDFYTSLRYKIEFLDQFQKESERIAMITDFDLIEGGSFLPFSLNVDVLSQTIYISKNHTKDLEPKDPKLPKINITATYAFQYPTNPCDYQKIKFRVITLLDGAPLQLTTVNQGNLLVNWTGVTSQYGPFYAPGIPYQNQFVEHFNPLPGLKSISYDLTFTINGQWFNFKDGYPPYLFPNQQPINYSIGNGVCTEIDDNESQWKQSGDWKMYAEVWVVNNWAGNRVGALTHSWKKKNNGNWKRKISNIEAEIKATVRNDECEFADYINDNDIENQERVDIVKYKLFKKYKSIINFDINSHHELRKGGTTIINDLKINGGGC